MLCSIIISLYNKADYIEAAVKSVLSQTYQNFELIIVDDGSTDDSAARVLQLQDPRIRMLRQPNTGVSCARNRGIAAATGELICFLDADDVYLPEYLATIVAMAVQYTELEYYATDYRRISTSDRGNWNVTANAPFEVIQNYYEHYRRYGAKFFTGSVAVRRDVLNHMQPCFPPGESMGEDLDLWFRLSERSFLAYCSTPLSGYRVGLDNSLTAIHAVHTLLPVWKRIEMRALCKQSPQHLRRSMLKLVAHERTMLARRALSNDRRNDSVRYLLEAWRGMASSRWWVTLMLVTVGSPSITRHWIQWRNARAAGR